MQRDHELSTWVVTSRESLASSLQFAHSHGRRTVFVVDDDGLLMGSVSSGDVYRSLTQISKNLASTSIVDVMHTRPRVIRSGLGLAEVRLSFTEKIDALPEVDFGGRLVAVWTSHAPTLRLGKIALNHDSPALVIAEIGNNHNGDAELALDMARAFSRVGADAVKFQLRSPGTFGKGAGDLGFEYVDQILGQSNLTPSQMKWLLDACWNEDILAFCTPWDVEALDFLVEIGVPALKIASADFCNLALIDRAIASGLPLLISTGMSTEVEVISISTRLNESGSAYVLLHTQSSYPVALEDINLKYMERLSELGNGLTGYSSHDLSLEVCLAAAALGARVIEKHVTMTPEAEGNDHRVSVGVSEFEQLVTSIRKIEQSLGTANARRLTQGELLNRESLSKSLVTTRSLMPGDALSRKHVALTSGGGGLPPSELEHYIGLPLVRAADAGDVLFRGHFELPPTTQLLSKINHKWGIPVRFRDYERFLEEFDPKILEFHLSVRDISTFEDQWDLKQKPLDKELVVHAPEIFEGDHLLDFASNDEQYRSVSLDHALRVVDLTRRMVSKFQTTPEPKIIFNVGGWSQRGFVSSGDKETSLANVRTTLTDLARESKGIDLLVQTMPPYPWHFGGQRYHNLFVNPDDFSLLEDLPVGVCLDVSHSWLASKHLGIQIGDFFSTLGARIKHLHLSDAVAPAGEGLAIGDGEIDFAEILSFYEAWCPDATLIVEVWQGHKDFGRLHRSALEKLAAFGF